MQRQHPDRKVDTRDLALILLAISGLMLILDVTITNVALPTIKRALDMSATDLTWVVNAYSLVFGGFLLLGGRLADRLGRRRIFLIGLAVFALASLLGGLATAGWWLIAARGLQGLGGALASPSALSIVTTMFAEGPERNRALGIMSAVVASGGALGMLLGGLLTEYASWRWVMWVNVPIGLLVLLAAPRVIPPIGGNPATRTDTAGAVAVSGGILALVFAIAQVSAHGWGSATTLGSLLLAVILLVSFIAIELRHPAPLVPLSVFRRRSLAGANTVALIGAAAVMASPIFFLTLYLQQILGFSAMRSGLAVLPLALSVMAASRVASRLVDARGPRPILAAGLILAAAGLGWLSGIEVEGSYLVDVLVPIVVLGSGMGLSFVPLMVSAVSGVPPRDQGLATGLLNTAQQLGIAVGLAVLANIAASVTAGSPGPEAVALTAGYAAGLQGAAVFALVGAVLAALILPRPPRVGQDQSAASTADMAQARPDSVSSMASRNSQPVPGEPSSNQ